VKAGHLGGKYDVQREKLHRELEWLRSRYDGAQISVAVFLVIKQIETDLSWLKHHGEARPGLARQSIARRSPAWRGIARRGMVRKLKRGVPKWRGDEIETKQSLGLSH
jgi:hypothetical protein